MSRTLLLVLALALVGVAGWLILAPEPATEGPAMSGPPAPEVEPAPGPGVLAPEAPAPPPAPPAVTRTEETTQPADSEMASAAKVLPSLADGEGIRVEVVAAEDGRPLAGAEVLVIDTGRVDEFALQESLSRSHDISRVVDALGEHYRTRADGSVVVPYVEEVLALVGRTEDRFLFQLPAVPDSQDTVRLELKPARSLGVRVVGLDGAGLPGVPVIAGVRRGSQMESLLSTESDAQGRAKLVNLGMLDSVMFRGDCFVGLGVLLKVPVEEEVELDDVPEEDIILRMPETGSLRVTVLGLDGEPVAGEVSVLLRMAPEDGTPPLGGPMEGPVWSLATNGVAEFPFVGLGLRIAVEARALGAAGLWRTAVDGPVSPGQQVELRLEPDRALPTIVVRLVDTAGEPLVGVAVDTLLEQEADFSSSSSSSPGRSDGEGLLRFSFDEPPMEGGTRMLTVTREAQADLPMLAGQLDLSVDLAGGEHDFGALVLAPPPLLASGIVLDPDGNPLAGADLNLEVRNYWGPEEDENYYWNRYWRISAKSGRDGRFSLQGLIDAQDVRVLASKDGFRDATEEVRVGASEVVLRMRRGASLAGRVLLDKGVRTDEIRVDLLGLDEDQRGNWQTGMDDAGNFSWNDLPDGSFDLTVRAQNGGEVFHLVEGVRLQVGGDNDDPRVREIDLRGKVQCFVLDFVDENGRAVRETQLAAVGVEPSSHWYAWDGQAVIVTAQAPLRLVAVAPGFREIQLGEVSADQEIRMQRGLPVRLVVDNAGAVPAGWQLGAWLQPVVEEGEESPMQGVSLADATFDASGVATLVARAPGTYELSFSIGRQDGRTRWGIAGGPRIEVADVAGEQRIVVHLDAEAMEHTRQQMIEYGDGR